MTCAFAPCDVAGVCALTAGCVVKRFPGQQPREQLSARTSFKESEGLKPTAPALNGTKGRASRDPRFIKRKRIPITRAR